MFTSSTASAHPPAPPTSALLAHHHPRVRRPRKRPPNRSLIIHDHQKSNTNTNTNNIQLPLKKRSIPSSTINSSSIMTSRKVEKSATSLSALNGNNYKEPAISDSRRQDDDEEEDEGVVIDYSLSSTGVKPGSSSPLHLAVKKEKSDEETDEKDVIDFSLPNRARALTHSPSPSNVKVEGEDVLQNSQASNLPQPSSSPSKTPSPLNLAAHSTKQEPPAEVVEQSNSNLTSLLLQQHKQSFSSVDNSAPPSTLIHPEIMMSPVKEATSLTDASVTGNGNNDDNSSTHHLAQNNLLLSGVLANLAAVGNSSSDGTHSLGSSDMSSLLANRELLNMLLTNFMLNPAGTTGTPCAEFPPHVPSAPPDNNSLSTDESFSAFSAVTEKGSSLSGSSVKRATTTGKSSINSTGSQVKTSPSSSTSKLSAKAAEVIAAAPPPSRIRRNYKNMTRERRMEANARERSRVHTIGAAFDGLQHLVPAIAPDQKLSKLSILRIGCKYILLLAAMAGLDYSSDQSNYSVQECIQMLNDTIINESKIKRK